MGGGSLRGCFGILHPQGWSVSPVPPPALGGVVQVLDPSSSTFYTPNPSAQKSQPVLQRHGGPAEVRKGPPLPRDHHIPGAGPDWDPRSHQYRLGASSTSKGDFDERGAALVEGTPLLRLSCVSSAGTPSRQHFGGAAGRAGGSCPLWDLEHPSSRGRESPKPSLPLVS